MLWVPSILSGASPFTDVSGMCPDTRQDTDEPGFGYEGLKFWLHLLFWRSLQCS